MLIACFVGRLWLKFGCAEHFLKAQIERGLFFYFMWYGMVHSCIFCDSNHEITRM